MDAKCSLKVVMNKQNTKVLFAEAGSDFANVLFSFLTLPLGKIVRLLQKQYGADEEVPAIGSLTTLYNGLANLDVANFYEEGVKQMLLNPPTPCSPVKYFCCENIDCFHSKKHNISLYHGIARCDCGKLMIRQVRSSTDESEPDDESDVGGVFAASGVSFIVSDDLWILPNVPSSVIQILGIADADFGDMQDLSLDFKEIMYLLKGLFHSRTPLTDILLNNGKITFATQSDQPEILLPKVENKKGSSSTSNQMTLKVTVQTSANKLLFAQSDEEFIELLFGLLSIPLGGSVRLLNGSTCAGNLDNLYKSVIEHIDEKYFESTNRLVVSEVPRGYMLNHSLLFEEAKASKIYYYRDDSVSLSHTMGGSCVKVTSFKFPEGYVKGLKLYIINDDLSVEPSGMVPYLSKLRMLEIPISDVSELELHIGLEEVLSILKAALVSKHALSHGSSPLLMKQPKQEQ